MKQDNKIIPERQIVPGMGSAIDYAELIKRDSTTEIQTIDTQKKGHAKTKVRTTNKNKFNRS